MGPMIDPALSTDLVAQDRASDFEYFRSAAGVREIGSRSSTHARGLITPEMSVARKELGQDSATENLAVIVEESSPAEREPDPLGHLRAARLGFAAAVILVLYWLWIRQKRKR